MALTPDQERTREQARALLRDKMMNQSTADQAADTVGMQWSIANGPQQIDRFGGELGNTWDEEVGRYRSLGEAGQSRGAVTLDQRDADQARGLQMGALGLMKDQATGAAPSAAAILGQRANQQASQQAAQRVAATRGIGSRIAASGAAGQLAGNQMMVANAQNAGARAAEISRGQQGYVSAAQGAMGQDAAAATTNAQLEAQQRAMNEKRQQEMERRASNARMLQLDSGMSAQQQYADEKANYSEIARRARQSQMAAGETLVSAVTAGGYGAISSGVAAKGSNQVVAPRAKYGGTSSLNSKAPSRIG